VSAYAEGMRRHADELVDEQLHRVRHRLDTLAPERRLAVEESVRAVVDGVAEAVLEEAPRNPALAAALESIYGH
jgi:molybdenum cofactor biosynthesis enzyme MoaA